VQQVDAGGGDEVIPGVLDDLGVDVPDIPVRGMALLPRDGADAVAPLQGARPVVPDALEVHRIRAEDRGDQLGDRRAAQVAVLLDQQRADTLPGGGTGGGAAGRPATHNEDIPLPQHGNLALYGDVLHARSMPGPRARVKRRAGHDGRISRAQE